MPISSAVRSACSFAFLCCLSTASLLAQASSSAINALRPPSQANRIAANADFGPKTQLANHIPGWVQPSAQIAKSVDLTASMHVSLVLQRDPAVQAAFTQLLADQQNPASPLYHEWLTPQQVGQLYGPTDADLAALTGWLTAQGLTVESVAPSKVILEVTGPGSAVASAFHTSFGYFNLNSQSHLSAISEPSIPTALTPIVSSISGLTELPAHPTYRRSLTLGASTSGGSSSSSNAQPNLTSSTGTHYLTPNDFATIYDINSVYSGGNKGATIGANAQHIAIIGRSRVAATDISEFAALSNISSYNLNTIIPTTGTDPGAVCTSANATTCSTAEDQDEATLDVDRVIGTAPGVQADLVVSLPSSTLDGIQIAASYNVNTLLDKIMTISFGSCEYQAGLSNVNYWNSLFSTAAGEGISVFVSSGDSGVNACASDSKANTTAYPASINSICASSYATCVGGTEFNDTASPSTYWSSTNSSGFLSALSYIPEGGWNEPFNSGTSTYEPTASGGGPSIYIAKPTWQTGKTIADSARDTPDLAFTASGHDGYYTCLDYALVAAGAPAAANCSSTGGYAAFIFSGTSASTPSMAGIAALLNTKSGSAQGNLNPFLYSLYTSKPSAFHDITVASSGVTSCVATTPSMCNNSTPGAGANSTTITGGLAGYLVQTGYDLVTGLGSLDVANFVNSAQSPTVSTTLSLTTVSPNPVAINSTVTLTATLTPSSTNLGVPTGTVSFYYTPAGGTATLIGSAVTISTTSPYTATTTTNFSAAGTYSITAVYSGDANYINSTASAVSLVVNLGPTFTINTGTAPTLYTTSATGVTDGITLASVNSFSGTVALSCSVTGITNATCSLSPTSAAVTATTQGSSTLTVTAPIGSSGALSVVVKGTSGSLTVSSTVSITAIAPSFTLSTPAALSFTSGATTGNTTSTTLTSTNGFVGPVTMGCVISTSSATYQPMCSITPTVTLAANGTGTATITISSTVPHDKKTLAQASLGNWGLRGAAAFATLLLLIPFRRRRFVRSLAAFALLAIGLATISGCGNGGTVQTPPQGSAGSYTVTVTGTGSTTGSTITTTATTTFSLTIN